MKKGQIKNWAAKVSFYAAKTIREELDKLGVKQNECEFFETHYIDASLADCNQEHDAPYIVICLAGSVIGGIHKAGVSGWLAQKEPRYLHFMTGSVDTREGWISAYPAEELENHDLTAEEAFARDVEDECLVELPE